MFGTVTTSGTQPSGNFNAEDDITDNEAGSNLIHSSDAVAPTGKWDETVPQVNSISSSLPSITGVVLNQIVIVTVTYSEPIDTGTFIESSNLTFTYPFGTAINASLAGGWSGGNTIYTKTYYVTTTPGANGAFTVTATGAKDTYGNVQITPDNVSVTISP